MTVLKYVNTGIVFQEIPDEVTLSVNLSNCPCHCPGCHSSYLAQDIGTPLTCAALDRLVATYAGEVTCLCFMGGDAAPESVEALARHLRSHHPQLKIGWYSGRMRVPSTVEKESFDYIKTGPYIAHLGGLKARTTNQRLYKRMANGEFSDITARFWG
jgi:anaerobic ribonucleoside-triphosphate reductase activating protein